MKANTKHRKKRVGFPKKRTYTWQNHFLSKEVL